MADENVQNKKVKEGDKWYVYSEDGKKKLGGPYDTEKEADDRLKEVEAFKHMKKNQRIQITNSVKPVVRNDRMEDRDWVVVPMVMLVEGVHNGSCGALYYPNEELSKTPEAWNAKPVVVYHPDAPTACDPDILTNRKVGVIMNTKYENGKLKAEAWLDPARMKKIDNRVAEAIEKGEVMELSTGLFTDTEGPGGEWGTEHYDAIARNYRPDHLALLPDMTGACSVADGAGFLRLNSEKTENRISDVWADTYFPFLKAAGIDTDKLTANELSHSTTWRLLDSAIRKKNSKAWVEEVFDSFLIYSVDGELYKQDYEVLEKDEGVKLTGSAEPAIRVVQYKTKTGTFKANKFEEFDMSKNDLIAKLIGNEASGWKNEDKDVLESMTEKQLETLCAKIPAPVKTDNKEAEKKTEVKVENKTKDAVKVTVDNEPAKPEPVKNEPAKPMTEEEYIAAAPVNIRNVLLEGRKVLNAETDRLIGVITKNPRNQFSKEFLAAKSIDELRGLAAIAVANDTELQPQIRMFDYSGQAAPVVTVNEDTEVLDLPVMNFSETK